MIRSSCKRARFVAKSLFLTWCVANSAFPGPLHSIPDSAVSGFVDYGGIPPEPKTISITKDREVCAAAPLYDQSLVIGRNRGLANVVVTLTDSQQTPPAKPRSAVKFDQKGCQYIPRVLVFPAGSTVVILNSDGILHNIHTDSVLNPVIDLAQPGFKKEIRVTIDKPEVIKVTCDAHNWMEGWWYATATPYYAVTGIDGRYIIRGLPPGTYTLHVWQERLGTQLRRVVLPPGAASIANFTYKPGKNQGS